jgi:hypothetical protein
MSDNVRDTAASRHAMTRSRVVISRPPKPKKPRLIAGSDVAELALLATLAGTGWASTGSTRHAFWTAVERLTPPATLRAVEANLKDAGFPQTSAREVMRHKIWLRLHLLEAYGLNRNRPHADLFGARQIDHCARKGRGVLLWVSHFVHHALVTKRTLREDGRAIHHISRPEHGFSKTTFGIHVLNRIRTRVEDRYSQQRLVLDEGLRYRGTLKRARRLLAEGRLCSVTAGAWEGYQLAYVPFLSGYLPLATGAISLCRICRADLLPVFTVWNDESGRFEVHVDEPLRVDEGTKNIDSAYETAAQYVERLLPWVQKYPGQWRDWHRILTPDEVQRLGGRSKVARPAQPG